MGPQGLLDQAEEKLKICKEGQKDFYESVKIVMEGAKHFMVRYHDLIMDMAENELDETRKQTMIKVAQNCKNISERPVPVSYTHLDVYKRQSWDRWRNRM